MTGFDWVTPWLAVGGRFAPETAASLTARDGVTGVIDLRAEDRDDAAALRRHGLSFLHLPTPDHAPPAPRQFDLGLRWAGRMLDGGGRLLVHCEHGIGRSATLALALMVDRGAAPLPALTAMKAARERISPSPAQVEALIAWLAARPEAGRAWALPDFDAVARIVYRPAAAGAA